MRALDQGVEFYRLGKPGSVVFNGISSEQVMDAHNDCMDGDHRCTVLESPGAMTSTELREDDYRGAGDGLKVISSVVRRLGLLARLGSRSIDTWIGNPDHICVEAFINPLDNEAYFALIADLLSPMLSPTWELVALGDDAPYSPPRPQFQIPGLHHHLDLRLRFRMS
ncbi:hypothetical protein OG474_43800 [Kribbella sp. NBC_01505]|uniref:hypothetical protein n=1 Tax=Kribbella sp. NBC_01505 TaxID=2903580 RepID=UPI003862E27B